MGVMGQSGLLDFLLPFGGHDVFLITSDDGVYPLVYAPTLGVLLSITQAASRELQQSGLDGATHAPAVIASLGRRARKPLTPFSIRQTGSRFFHLALGLTRGCTLRCRYCHADAGVPEHMPWPVLEGAIEHAFEQATRLQLRGVNVSFAVGGEPTYSWRRLHLAASRVRELSANKQLDGYLSMTTNGYYGRTKREFICRTFDAVLLSLDGPPDIQDFNRPTAAGDGSYERVVASGRAFRRAGLKMAVRATVTAATVHRLVETIEHLTAVFGSPLDVVFEPLVPIGRAFESGQVAPPEQLEFARAVLAAQDAGEALGVSVKTSAANADRLVDSFCGAMAIPAFCVTPNGVVTVCERDVTGELYGYGSFDEAHGVTIDHRREAGREELLEMPEQCLSCFCKWHCAGDCPDLRHMGYDRCRAVRLLIHGSLIRRLSKVREDA